MKVIISLFILSFIINTGCSTNQSHNNSTKVNSLIDSTKVTNYEFSNDLKNDLKELNLFGKVKIVKEFSYNVEFVNNKITQGNRKREYLNNYDNITRFDENGYIIEKKNFTSSDELYDLNTYKRDTKNNVTEEIYQNFFENVKNKFIYEYKDNHLSERKKYDKNNVLTNTLKYEYENNNKIVKSLSYDENGKYISTNISYYDENGNEVESVNKNVVEFTLKYTYNEKNRVVELLSVNSRGYQSFKYTYVYDINGNLIEEKEYLFDKELNKVKNYKYEFDEYGNWINCILYINNSPKFFLIREIEYYDSLVNKDLPENNTSKYIISDFMSIKIPPSLEIQSGNYKVISDNIKRAYKVNTSNAVFQPIGLNDFSKVGKTKYARIMVNIYEFISVR